MLGIARGEDTTGIMGFDAVRLWHEYERGSTDVLELLLKYNWENVVSLEKIIEPYASCVCWRCIFGCVRARRGVLVI